MGNNYSRRKFFKSLSRPVDNTAIDVPLPDNEDPLFKKYSRKKITARHYSTEQVTIKPGTEDISSASTLRFGNITSGLAPYTGLWTEWEVLHLLRRTNFGWKKNFVDTLLAQSPNDAVETILKIDTNPPAPPVNWYENVTTTSADENGLPLGADWTNDFFTTGSAGQDTNRYRMEGLRRWLFGLTLQGDITLREKMVWFWYHFIPIDFENITQSSNGFANTNSARIFFRYFKLFRDKATGNFKTIIRAVCTEPAMMFYLNNQANTPAAPDENFARELMELFTLGKDDPNNQYTQADVVAAARVLTGWRVQNLNSAATATNFLSTSHSTGNKQFSSFFNNTVINYQAGAAGANELDAMLTMIFSKSDIVSKYICRRLYRYFVYYDIDANIEANIITPLAQTFVANNWDILPVLKQLFKSQHFFDIANRGVYIKSPFDLVAGTANLFNLNTTDTNIESQYRIWSRFNDGYSFSMEQQMGTIPNVSGWNAFYQTPAFHQYWINSNAIQKRFSFIKTMLDGFTISNVPGQGNALRNFKVDALAFAQQFGNTIAADPDALTATCIQYLLPLDLSKPQKDQIKLNTLLSGQTNNSYWTSAWNTYVADPTNVTKKGVVESRMKNLLSGICQLAEFQLM